MISHYILDFPKPSVPGSAAVLFWFSLILGRKKSKGRILDLLETQSKIAHMLADSKALLPCHSRAPQGMHRLSSSV